VLVSYGCLASAVDYVILVLLASLGIIELFYSHVLFVNRLLFVSAKSMRGDILIHQVFLLRARRLGSLRPLFLYQVNRIIG
jgi:hypothetical protein